MKQSVVVAALWIGVTAGLPVAAAADPAPAGTRPSSAADVVFLPVNRSLFRQCAQGRDAAALIATRRDDPALAAANAAFERCTRTSIDPGGVAAAELGIAATAFIAGQSSTGEARRSAFARAADYAERADERWRSFHHWGLATGLARAPRVETRQGTDAVERVEVGLPGGPAPARGLPQGGRVPDYRTPAEARPAPFDALALALAEEARTENARASGTK